MASNGSDGSGLVKRKLSVGGDEYEVIKDISKGAIWRVHRAKRKKDGMYVALKVAGIKQCRHECAIFDQLSKSSTPTNHVVKFFTSFDKPPYRFLVTELCSTELAQFLQDLPQNRLPVDQLKVAAKHLVSGYGVLYENRIIHKNLSSKNILVHLMRNRVTLKISGFNCAEMKKNAVNGDDEALKTIVGRPSYMAPEIRRIFMDGGRQAAYDEKSDLWSIGLILYECAMGTPKAVSLSQTFVEAFNAGKYRPRIDWELIVPELYKILVDQLLRIPSSDRITASAVQYHGCIRSVLDNTCIILHPQIASRLPYDLHVLTNPPMKKTARVRNYEYVDDPQNVLGRGAFGKVWKAHKIGDNEPVALKRVYKDDVDLSEVETMKAVAHPNLLKLLDWFDEYPYMYMVTELCAQDLEHFLRSNDRRGRFRDESEAKVLARHLSSGYMAMKTAHILHRDIKPSNVLVSVIGRRASFKLADFGCSKKLVNCCYAQTVLGTPVYMAPELGACLYLKIENAHYDHRADIWSMGLILFKSLAAQLPFDEFMLKRLFYDAGTGKTTNTYAWRFKGEAERRGFSESFRDLLWKSLYPDYIKRMTAAEFFQHPFHSSMPISCSLEV